MRQNKPRCSLFTCTLTIVGALLLTTTLLSHNYATQQHHQIPRPHALRGPASHLAALRDAAKRKRGDAPPTTKRIRVTRDARGDEQLELDGDPSVGASRVVMMRWEKPYMEACADALASM